MSTKELHERCDKPCCEKAAQPSVCQSLDELDFEKGLWQAALDNNVQRIMKLVTNSKADPDVRDNYGYTALHYAARNGSLDAAKCLLSYGVQVNSQTKNNGATPLHRAITANRLQMVQLLLQNGADPSIKDYDGMDAFARADRDGRTELISILQKR